jgi:hypothetical protein
VKFVAQSNQISGSQVHYWEQVEGPAASVGVDDVLGLTHSASEDCLSAAERMPPGSSRHRPVDPDSDSLTLVLGKLIRFGPRPAVQRAGGEPAADTGLQWLSPENAPVANGDWGRPNGHSHGVLFTAIAPALPALVVVNACVETLLLGRPPAWMLEIDTL